MFQSREVKASHTAKELTSVVKGHLRRERKVRGLMVTVSPVINGHGITFSFKFQSECTNPDHIGCPRPISIGDQKTIAECFSGDLQKGLAPLLKEVGLKTFEVVPQKVREGATEYRCTIRAPGRHP